MSERPGHTDYELGGPPSVCMAWGLQSREKTEGNWRGKKGEGDWRDRDIRKLGPEPLASPSLAYKFERIGKKFFNFTEG